MGTVIKRGNTDHLNLIERSKITVTSGSLSQGMLTDDTVKLSVLSNSALDVKINDTLDVLGSTYRVNALPEVKKLSNSSYQYEIEAQGLMYDLLRCKFFNADGEGFKTTTNFPLIGTLETFLIAIRNNMHRFSNLWEIATTGIDGPETETKMINFGDDTCLSALQKICQEFKTDFWVKTTGGKFKIHTGEFGTTLPIDFEYGKGKGLYELSRKNVNDNDIVNRLYVNGGTENIPAGYRNFSDNLKFSDAGYLEDTALIAEIGLKEGSIDFPEIYPKRTGVVSAVGSTKFKFIDSSMDFDLNAKNPDGSTKYLIPGTSAKVHFNKGNLAGYEFEIKKGGYNNITKEFEIIPFKNESGQQFPDPNALAFQIGVGDEYVLLDIIMPENYVINAEAELLAKATEQFALKKTAKVSYDLNVDPEYMKTLPSLITIGDYVRVIDEALGVNKVIRVQAITREFITNSAPTPYNYKITLADTYEINYASQMVLDITDIKNVISITNLGNINLSQLGYKTTQELRNLIFDTDGYFDAGNIKPFSIDTSMLTVGAQSQQLSCSVVFLVNNAGNPNQVEVKAGALFSQTLNKTWAISGAVVTVPDSNYRYVYGKCSKTGTSGSIQFTQSQIKFDEDPNDFYFLIGILHTVTEGVRVLSITIGTTTINGGLIRTGTISSLDGQTYFNLNTGEIRGKITFTNDSPAFQQLNDSIVIGGRNLLRNSNKLIPVAMGAGTAVPSSGGGAIFNNTAAQYISFGALTQALSPGKKFTVSLRYRINNAKGMTGSNFSIFFGNGYEVIAAAQNNGIFNTISNTFTAQTAGDIYFIIPNAASVEITWIKIESGTKPTDWSPAPEDIDVAVAGANTNSANALAQAQNAQNTAAAAAAVTSYLYTTIDGNLITTGTALVGDVNGANAMITGVTDKSGGESIRFAAGKPYSQKYLSPFQVLDNGLVRFVNPDTGQKTFEIGFNQNTGKVIWDIYDDNGVKTVSIGPNGISFTGYIPESYTKRKFRKLTTGSFTQAAILAELTESTFLRWEIARGTPIQDYTVPWIDYDIGLNSNTDSYEYDPGRNFESSGNAQYIGFYTTANKFGTPIADGIYVRQTIQGARLNYVTSVYTYTWVSVAYLISGGKITNQLSVSKTVDLRNIPNKSSSWTGEDYSQ